MQISQAVYELIATLPWVRLDREAIGMNKQKILFKLVAETKDDEKQQTEQPDDGKRIIGPPKVTKKMIADFEKAKWICSLKARQHGDRDRA